MQDVFSSHGREAQDINCRSRQKSRLHHATSVARVAALVRLVARGNKIDLMPSSIHSLRLSLTTPGLGLAGLIASVQVALALALARQKSSTHNPHLRPCARWIHYFIHVLDRTVQDPTNEAGKGGSIGEQAQRCAVASQSTSHHAGKPDTASSPASLLSHSLSLSLSLFPEQ